MFGATPLMAAVSSTLSPQLTESQKIKIQLLLNNPKTTINILAADNRTALSELLYSYPNYKDSPLYIPMIRFFLKKGANPNRGTILYSNENEEKINALSNLKFVQTVIKDEQIAKLLMSSGAK